MNAVHNFLSSSLFDSKHQLCIRRAKCAENKLLKLCKYCGVLCSERCLAANSSGHSVWRAERHSYKISRISSCQTVPHHDAGFGGGESLTCHQAASHTL